MNKTEYQITKSRLVIVSVSVFLLSFSLLAFEIAIARLMSVILSYHYVFALVSLSLAGMGAGGILIQFLPFRASENPPSLTYLASLAGLCSLAMTFSAITAIHFSHMDRLGTNILLYCGIFFVPFFFGGMFLAKIFSIFPSLSSIIYGSDLAGAAAGCIGIILALNAFNPAGAIFFFAAIASISSLMLSFPSEAADVD